MGRALNRRATRAAHFNGVLQLALGCTTKLSWHGFGPCRRATFPKPDKPRRTASTAHAQRHCMTEDCSRIQPLCGYHHAIEQKISINAISPGNATRRVFLFVCLFGLRAPVVCGGLRLTKGALQTRTTVFPSFRRSECLRAPMGPILGGVGSLGDGVPEEIAGDKKFLPRPL